MNYNPALDGIRALAVLVVMAFHPRIPGFLGGYFGVDVFFILSGFLITTLLLAETSKYNRIALGNFYLRRFWRLAPPLLLMVVVYVAAISIMTDRDMWSNARDGLLAVFYLSDYSRAFWRIPSFFTHTWSLSVEAHFYLLWPLVLVGVVRAPHHYQRVAILVALYLLASGWRWYELLAGSKWDWVYYRFDTRMAGLCLGAVAAYIQHAWPLTLSRRVVDGIGVAGLAAIGFSVTYWKWKVTGALAWGSHVVEFGSVALLLVALTKGSTLNRCLSFAPVAYVGKLSYGLYLWHYPVMYFTRTQWHWSATFLTGTAIALVLSVLSYHTFELALAKRRRQLRPDISAESGTAGNSIARSA